MVTVPVREGGGPYDIHGVAADAGCHVNVLASAIQSAIMEARRARFPSDRIILTGTSLSFQKVAGRFLVGSVGENEGKSVTFEIVPKYVAPEFDPTLVPDGWMADLQAMNRVAREVAEANRHVEGHRSVASMPLADAADKLLGMLKQRRRQALWCYENRSWRNFNITGDLVPESVFLPEGEGFQQGGYLRSDGEEFRRVFERAAHKLVLNLPTWPRLPELQVYAGRDAHFGNSTVPPLPTRLDEWRDAYEFASDILLGTVTIEEIVYRKNGSELFATENLWEKFCLGLMRRAFGRPGVEINKISGAHLATGTRSGLRWTTPDIGIWHQGHPKRRLFVGDAKYKMKFEEEETECALQGNVLVGSPDLYQAISMMLACNVEAMTLFFPTYVQDQDWAVDNDTITVGGVGEPFGRRTLRTLLLNTRNLDTDAAAVWLRNLKPALVQEEDL